MKSLLDKVFVVTGAGNGMGRMITLALISHGAKVAGLDISESYLQETKALLKTNASYFHPYVIDITDETKVTELAQTIYKDFGRVDGLVNNAGIIQPFIKVLALKRKDIDRVMQVNFYGTLHMCRAFLPFLMQQPEASLVNVSSMGGFTPVPGQAIYGASKAAVKLLTEALYAELKGTSVRVSVVFPGAIGTNISQNSGVKMDLSKAEMEKMAKKQKTLAPEKAAAIIVKQAIQEGRYRVLVGNDAKTLDRLSRLFPQFATDTIAKAMKDLLK